MRKRLLCLFLAVCMMCSILCACSGKKITAEEAVAIVMEDLGEGANVSGSPHVHTGTFENKDCYNIYLTVDNESWLYVITTGGEILAKGPSGGHSH